MNKTIILILCITLLFGMTGCPISNNGNNIETNGVNIVETTNIITNWQDAYTNKLANPTNQLPVD